MGLFNAAETYGVWDVAEWLEMSVTEVNLCILSGRLEADEDGQIRGEAAEAFVAGLGLADLTAAEDRLTCGRYDLLSVEEAAMFLRGSEDDVHRLLSIGVLRSQLNADGLVVEGSSIIEALFDYLESDDNDPTRRGLSDAELEEIARENDVFIDDDSPDTSVPEEWTE